MRVFFSYFVSGMLGAMLWLHSLGLQAQTTYQYGLSGGLQAATLFGDTYSGLGPKLGIAAGGWVEQKWNDTLTFRVEMVFSQEGARNAKYDFSSFSTVIYDQRLQYNYLNFPLLATYQLPPGLRASAGLQLGLRLQAQETRIIRSGEPSPTDQSEGTRKFPGRIKLLYPSFHVGAEYPLSDLLTARARFFFSIFDNVKRNAGDSEGTYPLILQLSLAYQLGELTR